MNKKIMIISVLIIIVIGGIYYYQSISDRKIIQYTYPEPIELETISPTIPYTPEVGMDNFIKKYLKSGFQPADLKIEKVSPLKMVDDIIYSYTYESRWDISDKNFIALLGYNNNGEDITSISLSISYDDNGDINENISNELSDEYLINIPTEIEFECYDSQITLKNATYSVTYCESLWLDGDDKEEIIITHTKEIEKTSIRFCLRPSGSDTYERESCWSGPDNRYSGVYK